MNIACKHFFKIPLKQLVCFVFLNHWATFQVYAAVVRKFITVGYYLICKFLLTPY